MKSTTGGRNLCVELRSGTETIVLARLSDAFPHHATLDPFVTWMTLQGLTGELVLVDQAAAEVVARRQVGPDLRLHRRRRR